MNNLAKKASRAQLLLLKVRWCISELGVYRCCFSFECPELGWDEQRASRVVYEVASGTARTLAARE